MKNQGSNKLTYSTQVSATTSATLVLDENQARQYAYLMNAGTSGGATIYFGTSGVTTSTGFPLAGGQGIGDPASITAWYAIVAADSAPVAVLEVS